MNINLKALAPYRPWATNSYSAVMDQPRTILRLPKDKDHPYTQISNLVFDDVALDMHYYGILPALLRYPDTWEFYKLVDVIMQGLSCCEKTARKHINFLIDASYLHPVEYQDAQFKMVRRYKLTDIPLPREDGSAPRDVYPCAGIQVSKFNRVGGVAKKRKVNGTLSTASNHREISKFASDFRAGLLYESGGKIYASYKERKPQITETGSLREKQSQTKIPLTPEGNGYFSIAEDTRPAGSPVAPPVPVETLAPVAIPVPSETSVPVAAPVPVETPARPRPNLYGLPPAIDPSEIPAAPELPPIPQPPVPVVPVGRQTAAGKPRTKSRPKKSARKPRRKAKRGIRALPDLRPGYATFNARPVAARSAPRGEALANFVRDIDTALPAVLEAHDRAGNTGTEGWIQTMLASPLMGMMQEILGLASWNYNDLSKFGRRVLRGTVRPREIVIIWRHIQNRGRDELVEHVLEWMEVRNFRHRQAQTFKDTFGVSYPSRPDWPYLIERMKQMAAVDLVEALSFGVVPLEIRPDERDRFAGCVGANPGQNLRLWWQNNSSQPLREPGALAELLRSIRANPEFWALAMPRRMNRVPDDMQDAVHNALGCFRVEPERLQEFIDQCAAQSPVELTYTLLEQLNFMRGEEIATTNKTSVGYVLQDLPQDTNERLTVGLFSNLNGFEHALQDVG